MKKAFWFSIVSLFLIAQGLSIVRMRMLQVQRDELFQIAKQTLDQRNKVLSQLDECAGYLRQCSETNDALQHTAETICGGRKR